MGWLGIKRSNSSPCPCFAWAGWAIIRLIYITIRIIGIWLSWNLIYLIISSFQDLSRLMMMMMMVIWWLWFTAGEEWVIIHIEVGDGLFDRGVWWLISSLMEVTYPIHGIVYKSALIGHRHATHPVVDVLMWCDLGVWHQFVMVFIIWFINKAVKTENQGQPTPVTEVPSPTCDRLLGKTLCPVLQTVTWKQW